MIQLIHGDCLDKLKELEDNSVDSIVTDPPYGLSFMGKKWDYDVPSEDIWRECLRVLKPGGHLLAFAGTRTQHRMAVRIEDAGFEIRDMIAWIYGSGFPKSLNIGKAVDKLQGNEREDIGAGNDKGRTKTFGGSQPVPTRITKGTSPYEGWGTALKPALEPITVARKPLMGTVAQNVLTYGTGGINIDGCRVEANGDRANENGGGQGAGYEAHNKPERKYGNGLGGIVSEPHALGRFPANLIHDGSEEVVGLFPNSSGGAFPKKINGTSPIAFRGDEEREARVEMKDSGSAARFFYCAKASKKDREEGCAGLNSPRAGAGRTSGSKNHHPTVKPTDLMRYLCRLVTPPGGIVLDPFMGSGSTGKAAVKEGFSFIGIESEAEYVEIAQARINNVV